MARNKKIIDRRLRLLDLTQGRRLQDAYLLDPEVRSLLEWEAARSEAHFKDALLTPEILSHLETFVRRQLEAEKLYFPLDRPSAAAVSVGGRTPARKPVRGTQDVVVIVPGNMASSLADIGCRRRLVWFNVAALSGKGICDLQLGPFDGTEQDATPGVDIVARRMFPGLYDILEGWLDLSRFATLVYSYDWRKDVGHESVAQGLKTVIQGLTGYRKVHLVAHSLGGLVARKALQCLCAEIGIKKTRELIGQLVLLAPNTSGTFAGALGLAASIRELPGGVILPPPSKYVQPTTKTWTSLYQLLPWDCNLLPSLKLADHDVRTSAFWRGKIDPDRLSFALPPGGPAWASTVDTRFLDDRTSVVLGYTTQCATAGGVFWKQMDGKYVLKSDPDFGHYPGDGFMLHRCSVLENTQAYVACGIDHMRLPLSGDVIQGVVDLLHETTPTTLAAYRPDEVPCPELSVTA